MYKTNAAHNLSARLDTLFALCVAWATVLWVSEPQLRLGGRASLFAVRITLFNAAFTVGFAFAWSVCFALLGLHRAAEAGWYRMVMRAAGGSMLMTAVLSLYLASVHARRHDGRLLLVFFAVAFGFQVCRLLLSTVHVAEYMRGPSRVIILGSGPRASKAWRALRTQHSHTKQLLGFVDDRDPAEMPPDISRRSLGNVDSLPEYLLRNAVDELIVATPRSSYDITQRAISIAESAGLRLLVLNDVYELKHQKALRERSTMFLELVPKDSSREMAELAKRVLDAFGAAAGLVVLAPLFLAVGLAIKLTSAGPVFFVQERYGYRRRQFKMYKFRSMVRDAPALMADLESQNEACGPIFKMKEDPRVTRLGRLLRQSSLDELPQLWNVLKGDMSLVGPRPMSVRDVSLFSEAQLMRRFSVRPGMTGIWQVSERSAFNFDRWVQLDFSYIDHWSLALDMKILAQTVPAVLKRSGAV